MTLFSYSSSYLAHDEWACGNYAVIILEIFIADTILELFWNNLGIIRIIWE